jgi:predicted enzyme related to lactoylglutathione lyase
MQMGQPVVHFEVMGKDGPRLQSYYSELFGWEVDAHNPMKYGLVKQENRGIAGGIGGIHGDCSEEHPGHVTFYVEVPDVEDALGRAEALGGTRIFGPERVTEGVELGQFTDPEGHLIGLLKAA